MVRSSKRVRRGRAAWAQLLERCRRSGLSEAAFCRREQISKSSFARWKRQLGGVEPEPAAPRFVEWTAPPCETRSSVSGELTISLPGGVVVRWKA